MNVTIANPEDPFGPPTYEGPADQVHALLRPGLYITTDPTVAVLVADGQSFAAEIVPVLQASVTRDSDSGTGA